MASFVLSGATTLAAADARAAGLQITSGGGGSTLTTFSGSGTYVVTLSSGTTTITANYRAIGGGTATFAASSIIVQVY
jgi:hypothetical protein